MKDEQIEPIDGVQLLRTYLLHCRYVRRGLKHIERALNERAEAHDDSKLFADEFAGFSRINKAARQHPYGSAEYRAGLKQEKPTIDRHYSRNSHHPEFFGLRPRGCPDHASDPYPAGCPDCLANQTQIHPDIQTAFDMTWLDLIEMVCDWRGAYLGYGSQGTWEENMKRQHERYAERFRSEQWWLIDQIAVFVSEVKA